MKPPGFVFLCEKTTRLCNRFLTSERRGKPAQGRQRTRSTSVVSYCFIPGASAFYNGRNSCCAARRLDEEAAAARLALEQRERVEQLWRKLKQLCLIAQPPSPAQPLKQQLVKELRVSQRSRSSRSGSGSSDSSSRSSRGRSRTKRLRSHSHKKQRKHSSRSSKSESKSHKGKLRKSKSKSSKSKSRSKSSGSAASPSVSTLPSAGHTSASFA